MLLGVFFPDSWTSFLIPNYPLVEIFIRGTIIYLFLFFALRFILKRETAGVGISDLLVIVLIADAVQNGMAGDYTSVPDALVLALTIIGWDWALAFIAFHFPRVRRLIRPAPMKLIDQGRLLSSNVKQEMLTHEEIIGQLRMQGIDSVDKVKEAWIETDGMITAIPKKQEEKGAEKKERRKN
jgi:uncharacterized membrane protein YcaP (DUF421 family)